MSFLKQSIKSLQAGVTSGINPKEGDENSNRRRLSNKGKRRIMGGSLEGVRRIRDSSNSVANASRQTHTTGKCGGFKAVISARLSS